MFLRLAGVPLLLCSEKGRRLWDPSGGGGGGSFSGGRVLTNVREQLLGLGRIGNARLTMHPLGLPVRIP